VSRGRGSEARDLPSTALLNLGDVELQQAVQPIHEFLPTFPVFLGQPILSMVWVSSSSIHRGGGGRWRVVTRGANRVETNRDSPILRAWLQVWSSRVGDRDPGMRTSQNEPTDAGLMYSRVRGLARQRRKNAMECWSESVLLRSPPVD
jgi:hypothetical protein